MSDISIIQAYLAEHIPITNALGIALELDPHNNIIVHAPLKNNINHKMTVFGGSLHAIATLACWSFLYKQFIDQLEKIEIVISRSEIDYLLPVTSDFKAICSQPDRVSWEKFSKVFNKKGKARIILNAEIYQADQLAVNYHGTFVVTTRS